MQAKDEVQSGHFQMEIYELKWQQDITRKQARKPRSYASPKLRPTHLLTHWQG